VNLVDTNVLIDLLRADPVWKDWSEQQLLMARASGGLVINAVVYAELAAVPETLPILDDFLDVAGITVQPLSRQCARLAGQAFWTYRRRKGVKSGVLPDFFIGAQAQAEGWSLLTRDASRYRTYFPTVKLICPQP
jgi:predicted nucleic acid-binding protein